MKIKIYAVLILALFFFFSCGEKTENKGIKLKLEILPKTITDFLYAKINYSYNLTEKFSSLKKDYTVFVHLWRLKNKEMLLQDDHIPEIDTSKWKKGDKFEYSREIFIPKFLDEIDIDFEGYEEIKLTVGLYDPKSPENKIILYKKILNIQPASVTAPEILYSEGWNNIETNIQIKNPDERKWKWTTRKAVCIIENPKKESVLIIRGGVDKSKFKDQKVIIKINDKILNEEFKFIPETAKFKRKYIISPEQMGNDYEFKLTIETDKTFVPSTTNPATKDNRELGIQIYFLYFREALK